MKLNARLRGMDGLRRSLDGIADKAELRGELAVAGENLRDAVRAELNSDARSDASTARLSRSLMVGVADDGTDATVSTPLSYGWHLEFGGLDRPPRPWLVPALDKARPGILTRLRDWLSRAAKRGSS